MFFSLSTIPPPPLSFSSFSSSSSTFATRRLVFALSLLPAAAAQPSSSDSVDQSNLPLQIGGIVGSYLISAFVVGVLLLSVGRRLRTAAQTSNCTLELVMLSPETKHTVSTTASPRSDAGKPRSFTMPWNSFSRSHRSHTSPTSSMATVDETIVLSDRRKAQDEMEKLYAAVMEHQDAKGSVPIDENNVYPMGSPVSGPSSPIQFQPHYPLPSPQPHLPAHPESLPQQESDSRPSSRRSKISNLSIFSPGPRTSGSRNKPRQSIRTWAISPPMGSPDLASASSDGESQPLTPRSYNPGPPPSRPSAPNSPNRTSMPSVSFGLSNDGPSSAHSTRAPPPPALKVSSATTSSSSLPFRQAFSPPQSAPATKTTILERPEQISRPLRTGMPTPYSPYMPFTPVTPITPSRLVSRQERRRREKENGLRVLMEDDMVKDDHDMWGY
ncbi:hypothetical protein V8E54_010063 [Elaphomyces granulatus]